MSFFTEWEKIIKGLQMNDEKSEDKIPLPKALQADANIASSNNEPMLQFFEYAHLRNDLKEISKPFGDLARQIVKILPRNPERTVALRKLLEAKDCAVRSWLYKHSYQP